MTQSHKHIDLGRQFPELGDGKDSEDAALGSYVGRLMGIAEDSGWDSIYREDKSCVILGEPGSGKSEELRHQAQLLRDAGKPAAYVDLASLLTVSTLYKDDLIRRWRRSDTVAWFFLDSVDESKLERVADFHRALTQMANWVGVDASRARYVISSRISEWRAVTDKRLVEAQLLRPPDGNDAPAQLRVLKLLPLTSDQARAFQAHDGAVDEAFFAAVERADAWEFLGRPLDVTDIYALWQRLGRLGTLTEVVANAIERLLEDPRERSSLPATTAREGAEYLAACLTLHKSVSVMLSDAVLPDSGNSLMMRDCLPQKWSEYERAQIIQRPLFDAAAYGKIRFHHRSYQDYLACCWLARLMRMDLPPSELRHLLFSEGANGALTLRPSLAPVAAWLACIDVGAARWQKHHRQDLLNAAPWVFFAHGDPQNLPTDYKARVLQSTVEHYKGRDRVRIDRDGPTLKRFADPALSPTVSRYIEEKSVAADVRDNYIALVRYGKLIDAMPSVVATATDPEEDKYLRAIALICIADIGLLTHRSEIFSDFSSLLKIPVRLGVQLVEVVYPHVIDEPKLFSLLARFDINGSRSRSSSLYSLDHYIEKEVPLERVPALLDNLLRFLRGRNGVLRSARMWVADWIAPLVTRLLGSATLTLSAQKLALDALQLLEVTMEARPVDSIRGGDALKVLAEASSNRPQLRRAWYWRKIERHRTVEHEEPSGIWQLNGYYSPLKWIPQDLDWWMEDINARGNVLDRVFALRVMLSTQATKRGKRPLLPSLVIVSKGMGEPLLRRELLGYLRMSFSPRLWVLRNQLGYDWRSKHFWRRRFQPITKRYSVLRDRTHFWWKRKSLERGEWWNGSWFIIERARTAQLASRWGAHDLSKVIALYGEATVRATMAGVDRIWRNYRPPLPHEKVEQTQTSSHTVLGLVALEVAWETRGASYFQELSTVEAEFAARYALDELNGLPPWFATLASAHKKLVCAVLAAALRGEWQAIAKNPQLNSSTLQRLVYAKNLSDSLYLPIIKDLLSGMPQASTLVLRDSLHLVMRSTESPKPWLVPEAVAHLGASGVLDEKTWPWLLCLFLLDADRGLAFLEERFKDMTSSAQDEMCQALCANLLDEFGGGLSILTPSYGRAAFLRRFIPWVYRHIRVADDAVHDDAYSPDERDHAEQFRDSLLGRLEGHAGAEVDEVLAELANDSELSAIRDFVLMRIENRRAAQADDFVIEPADVHMLLENHERVPRNRADLFHTAWSRLRAFKDNVEFAEVSLRHECVSTWDEGKYQDWLQRHLLSAANGKYTLPSEAKVDPGKFPDLRFEAPGVDGAVSVEVKVATFEHWSCEKLEERLCNQLVGQYLRASNAKYGVFLLFRANKERHWRPSSGGELDWTALLLRLRFVAKKILDARPDLERLEVLGIDVTFPDL
ncbi:MAG: hypothetical protein WAV22_11340 [Porticoccaceae bacterium]